MAKRTRYVNEELPYKLLMQIYKNSRSSLRELGRNLNIAYHTVDTTLKEYEKKYGIVYTLDLDGIALGFSEGRIITFKFERMPSIDLLKDKLSNDVFVQDAYLANGDFDLVMYVVGLTQRDFQQWQFNLRVFLSDYGPNLKVAAVNSYNTGFFPLKNDLISKSEVLSDTEKRVLTLLNSNSRIKFKELVERSKSTPMKTTYIIKKLQEKGVIKSFSALTQNPNRRIFLAYSILLTPTKDHFTFAREFAKKVVSENAHQVASDYSVISNTNGAFDSFYVCTFDNGEELSKRGPELLRALWGSENPKLESAMLTDLITGLWPFHLDEFTKYKKFANGPV